MTSEKISKRRLIEDSLPLKTLGNYAKKEKAPGSKGKISNLHLWWARRPITLSRALIASCLLPAPVNSRERKELHNLLIESCTLEAGQIINERKKGIQAGTIDRNLKDLVKKINMKDQLTLLDPFAGGGSIPFEALRLGLDVIASDLNPVSHLIREAGQRLISKHGLKKSTDFLGNKELIVQTHLIIKLEKWGEKVIKRAYDDLKDYYDDSLTYLWIKTCHCITCGNEIPLHSLQYVSKKKGKELGIFLKVNERESKFKFEIKKVRGNQEPSKKLRDRKGVTCPFCKNQTTNLDDVKTEGKTRGLGYSPLCKLRLNNERKREYVPMTEEDLKKENNARNALLLKLKEYKRSNFVPNEITPPKEALGNRVVLYGYDRFDKFFTPRQLLVLGTISEKIRKIYTEILEEDGENVAKTIILLLAFTLDRLADYNSIFSTWHPNLTQVAHFLSTPQFRMTWDIAEPNPFTPGSGSWESMLLTTIKAAKNCLIPIKSNFTNLKSNATDLPIPSNSVDLVVTDPPYYDYIGYADLSDFFYVWLKRTIGHLFPDTFKTPLTPKKGELILSKKEGQDKISLAEGLRKAWTEVSRVMKPNGILVVMFTHKSTEAWEQLFQTLHASGFYATATWPVLSESPTKLLKNRANVNTTLNVICRKRSLKEEEIGYFKNIKVEFENKIKQRCKDFWNLDMYGSDFFVAAIGPSMEVYAKYRKIIRTSGEEVSIGDLITYTREIVSNFVLEKMLAETATALDIRSRIYILWRWAYLEALTSADDLLTFLKGVGGEREELESEKRIKIDKSKVSYLGPFERKNSLKWESSENWEVNLPLIDHLHISCILREEGAYEDYQKYLKFINVQNQLNHPFWKLTRSLVEILQPLQSSGKNSGKGRSKELEAYRKVLENIPDIKRTKEKPQIKLNGFLSKGK